MDRDNNPLKIERTLPHNILEESNFNFKYVQLSDLHFPREKMAKLYANSGDPDQTLHSVASDLGLHCVPITLLWVSRLQWDKQIMKTPKTARVSSNAIKS